MTEVPEGYYLDGGGKLHRQHDVYGGPHDEPPIPDDPAVLLAGWREALERVKQRHFWALAPRAGSATVRASLNDIQPLVAAVQAVLELHQPADRGAGAQCKGCATHVTFTRWPCPTVQAITAALTGEGNADEHSWPPDRNPGGDQARPLAARLREPSRAGDLRQPGR